VNFPSVPAGAHEKFVKDFVAAWNKVMNLDRYDRLPSVVNFTFRQRATPAWPEISLARPEQSSRTCAYISSPFRGKTVNRAPRLNLAPKA
jgi:hypothetical protein